MVYLIRLTKDKVPRIFLCFGVFFSLLFCLLICFGILYWFTSMDWFYDSWVMTPSPPSLLLLVRYRIYKRKANP